MKELIVLFLIIGSCFTQTLNELPGIPQSLIKQANQALKNTVPQLQQFSSGRYCRYKLYKAIKDAVGKLQEIQKILDQNNVVVGNNNAISGDGNVIIGNQNAINGDDNWLISINKIQRKTDKTLIFRNWEIKMDKVDMILANPNAVIKTLNGVQKNQYNQYFEEHKRSHDCQCNLFCCQECKNHQASAGCQSKRCNNEESSHRNNRESRNCNMRCDARTGRRSCGRSGLFTFRR